MYFAIGPYDLLTALYLTYVKEIPLVPYASILGLSLSAHSFPFIMFIQVLFVTNSSEYTNFLVVSAKILNSSLKI